MANEIAVDSFMNLLGQSDLLPDDQLLALIDQVRGEGMATASSKKLAESLVERQVLTVWQADMLLKGKNRGFRLGPYRILMPLGQGGMSKVFLAEHETMRRRCAIKVLPSKYQEDADLLKRFQLEAVAIAALDHPNIVRAYDFNRDERYGKQIPYLVMEYVEGQDLRRMVEEQGPLDYRKAANFICQAAEGLAHAHAHGFVHRDIKPANLLVDPQGVLKVLDLGLATFAEAEQTLNGDESAPSAVGTADYVAPEQVVDSRNVDGRADIYSLGLTFYFMLTGRRPFTKSTIMELLMAHRNEKPEPITASRPDVPMDLEAIIDKMIAKSPFQRYQTAKDLAEKLRKWLKESGSARTYSRISALMAEALRAKQPSAQDTTRAAAAPTEDAGLELAALADEQGNAPAASAAPVAAGRESSADGAKGRAPGSSGSSAKIGQAPAQPSGGTSTSDDKHATAAVKSAPLPGLAMEDLIASLPPAEPLSPSAAVESARSHGKLKAIKKQQGGFREFLRTPWPWVGLIGVVFLAVLIFLFVLIASVPPSTTPVEPAQKPSEPAVPRTKSPSAAKAKPSTKAPAAGPTQTAKAKPSLPTTTVTEPPAKSDAPSQTAKVEAPDASTAKTAEPPTPAAAPVVSPPVDVVPPAPTETPPPDPPQPPPEAAVDTDALLADLTPMKIQVTSFDTEGKSPLNPKLRQLATAAAKSLNISIVEDDPAAVMAVDLAVNKTDKLFDVVISVKVTRPAEDDQMVTVWSHKATVFSGDEKRARIMRDMKVFSQDIGRKITAAGVFSQFRSDVMQARAKVGSAEKPVDE